MEVKSGRSEWPPEVKCPQRSSLVGQVSGQDLRPDLTCVFRRTPSPVTVTSDLQVWVTVFFLFSSFYFIKVFFKIKTRNRVCGTLRSQTFI
jgi:hypothetical protein